MYSYKKKYFGSTCVLFIFVRNKHPKSQRITKALNKNQLYRKKEKNLKANETEPVELNFPQNNIDSSDLAWCNHRCYRKGVKTIFTLLTVQSASHSQVILIRAAIWNGTVFHISLVKSRVTSIRILAFFSFVCIWWVKCMFWWYSRELSLNHGWFLC